MTLLSGRPRGFKLALLGATLLTGLSALSVSTASAQDATPPADDTVVVVTGYRGSLQSSTAAKKRTVGFSESIFSEDMGKFPDTNLAESFNRVPGVNISREITGEGINVAIRGLGTNFTKVLLNGAPVSVASTGSTDSQNTNREVDLDLLPTELFSQLTVTKSPTASLIEGGAAGTVNMRQARPFDFKGKRLVYSATAVKNSEADDFGYKGSLLGSMTGDTWGVLAGVSYSHTEIAVSGFETIGWTNANLSATQNTGARNTTGGGNWTIPGTVPANAGNGLTTGTTIDQAFLLTHNPGLNITQIDNALIPRLGRPMNEYGSKDRLSAVFGLEFRPSETLRFYLDSMYAHKDNQLTRTDMNWVGRNGAAIPLNMKVDRSDCSLGCVVTEATFANAQFFLEYRPHNEEIEFTSLNPGFEWEISDTLKLAVSGNYTKSEFHRESPTFLPITAASSGVTVTYKNDGILPVIESSVDLNNPANFQWTGGRVNMQDERRETETKGLHADLTWGDSSFNIQAGLAYDDVSRSIKAFDNSQAWQNAVCGNNPNVFVPAPNGQPPCRGDSITNLTAAIAAGYPSYPGLGTGYSTGAPALAYGGSLIPTSALASYMSAGPYGYVTVDWDRFAAAAQYDKFHDAAPEANGANTGASAGYIREEIEGAYIQVNGDRDIFGDHRLRYNIGIRAVTTNQTIGGRVSIPDPRNSIDPDGAGPLPNACPGAGNARDGSCYPNVVNFATTESTYKTYLPSVTFAFNWTDSLVMRVSKSTTMTRANPNTMLPGLSFSSPSADIGNVGNAGLKPFMSENTDFGLEWYTGKEGYVAIAAFKKEVDGFTQNGTTTVPFSALAQYGVTYDTLSPTQQAAINARGGPTQATVVLQQQVNNQDLLTINGTEVTWVQPLDQWFESLDGFGFSANATFIKQKSVGTAIATGVPKTTWNFTAYYEKDGVMVRLSDTYRDGAANTSGGNQNGISNLTAAGFQPANLYSDSFEQLDLAASLDLEEVFDIPHGPQLTLDVINLTGSELRTYFQFPNATFTYYKPGTTVMFGIRGKF